MENIGRAAMHRSSTYFVPSIDSKYHSKRKQHYRKDNAVFFILNDAIDYASTLLVVWFKMACSNCFSLFNGGLK